MTVIASFPHNLKGQGPARPIGKIIDALRREYKSELVEMTADSFRELDDTRRLGDGIGGAYDDLATYELMTKHGPYSPTHPDVFIGGGACLNQMRILTHLYNPGLLPKTVTTWFSSNASHAQSVLTEEYLQWGIPTPAITPYLVWRAAGEQALSDTMVVPSEACAQTYPTNLSSKIRVCEFGVDSIAYRPGEKRDPREELSIVIPATNPPRKGMRFILEALKDVDPMGMRITATGNGSWSGGDGIQVRNTGLKIQTPGWIPEDANRKLLSESHILLLPSLEEGQALAAFEAAACGMPLIVTPNAGHKITDGKEGFLVPPRDSGAIRKAIQYFQDNPKEIERMGKEARAYAEAHPWERFQEDFLNIVMEAT